MDVGLLAQWNVHQRLDQAQMLRILAQQDEQGMFGVIRHGRIGAHGGSLLTAWDAPEHSR